MKINKRTVDMLCNMSDERLWGAVKLFAASQGVDLSKKRVNRDDLQRLRRALSSLTEDDLVRVGEIIKIYKGR